MKSSLICLALFAVFASSVQARVDPAFLKGYNDTVNECRKSTVAANKPQCFLFCVWIKFGLIDGNGILNLTTAKNYIEITHPRDRNQQILGNKIFAACAKENVDGNPCLAAEQHVACVRKKAIETGFDYKFF